MIKLNNRQARSIALHTQGLNRNFPFGKGKSGALKTIEHLGYLQLDTLAVVARAHHHTLYTRTGAYKENHLDQLIKEKKIFEYWGHAASYLPMKDFRFSLVRKESFKKGRSHWFAKDKKIMQYVLGRIKAEGPLQSRDFETNKNHGSWFDWKPAKNALEQLFQDGTLMIAERKGFQKVYDLAEHVLPSGTDTKMPTTDEYARYLIKNTLQAHGFASAKEIAYLRKGMSTHAQRILNEMLKEKEIVEVLIEDVKEKQYIYPESLNFKQENNQTTVSLLSPFDNAVIMRNRLKNIFDFNYGVECYLPEHKRKFGYFCLPILYGNNFAGRLDSKADRHKKEFIIKSLHIEHPPADMDKFLSSLAISIKEFAAFNACKKITIKKTFPPKIKADLKSFKPDLFVIDV